MTPIRHLRWYIGGLLFLSTVINYIDRQTLSVLAPYLKVQYSWSNADFAWVLIAFRVAYTIGQTIAGRMVDRLGTRVGLSLAVAWYSIAAMATSMAGGLRSFLNLPADIYPTGSVATVSGLGGTAAGVGTIAAIYTTGWVADRYSFEPILLGASVVPLVGMAAMLLLVRNTKESREGILNEI